MNTTIDIENVFKNIRTLYQTISGKSDVDVSMTYKGNSYGITKPWIIKIDSRESNGETHVKALTELLTSLRQELSDKANSTEKEANRLKLALAQLGN